MQLLALEVARRALADAGYADRPFDRARTSVVFGAEAGTDLANAYGFRANLPHYLGDVPAELLDARAEADRGLLPRRAGQRHRRTHRQPARPRGANYTVDAACGASLAAVESACKELAAGSSDLVLCGGADLHNGINDYLLFAGVRALSPTGRCRTFDSSADGIALGEGVGCVVLKRLADAERDGDRIYAVIKGVGASSDGRALGLTAPRKEGQERALERAYAQAGVSPASVGLVEAHGTGTVVGDRTELATLTEVFERDGRRARVDHARLGQVARSATPSAPPAWPGSSRPPSPCTAACCRRRCTSPGPTPPGRAEEPVRVPRRRPAVVDEERRAGVSAFGFGGTNFHAVLVRVHAAATSRPTASTSGRPSCSAPRATADDGRAGRATCWRCSTPTTPPDGRGRCATSP